MSYTIKNNISFDEYEAIINKVIEDSFTDGVYSPAAYELSLKVSIISAFAPDYDLSECKTNNELWEKVNNDVAEEIFDKACKNKVYFYIIPAIEEGISHRLRAIEASPMSMSDIALAKLINVVTDKIDSIDTEVLNKDTISALINADKQINKEDFERKLVDEMLDRGLISKPNRATRRKSSKGSKNTEVKTNVVPINAEEVADTSVDKE